MYFVISGGGTAGHINPALALGGELQARGHDVEFIGTPNGMEARLAVKAGFEFIGLEAAGYDRAKPITFFTSSAKIAMSSRTARHLFKRRRPNCVVGFGGYVCLPVGLAAHKLGIPLLVHEQNSVPGLANKELVKRGAYLAMTFEHSRKYFNCPDERVFLVGNPVRESILEGSRERGRAKLGLEDGDVLLLVSGGSLGAKHLNETLAGIAGRLLENPSLHVLHSCGQDKFEQTRALFEGRQRWVLRPFIDDMGDMMCASDLIVSRAGSTSLAEIAAVGRGSVLVPFPYATDDHQTINASDFERCGAALSWPDSKLEDPGFADALSDLLADRGRMVDMGKAAAGLAKPDACRRLADIACDLGGR